MFVFLIRRGVIIIRRGVIIIRKGIFYKSANSLSQLIWFY